MGEGASRATFWLGSGYDALMSGSKKIVIAVGVGVLIALGLLWWGSPVPVPGMHSAQEAADQIAESDPVTQRAAARKYGALVAKTSDWEGMAERGAALPLYVQDTYFSAVAYSDFLSGLSPDDALEQMQQHLPETYHPLFCNGLVRLYASANAASPDDVLTYMDTLAEVCGGVDLADGLRIGVQEAMGESLGEAFAVIETYPPDLHDLMVEELGWRHGDAHGMSV